MSQHSSGKLFQSLPNNKILNQSTLEAIVDDNLNVNQILKFAFGRVQNVVGKAENGVPFLHNVFKMLLYLGH